MLAESIGNTILPIVMMVLVIVAAYYSTRAISMKARKLTKGKCLHVIDRIAVGRDKQILLVRAGDEVYLVGVTGQSMASIGTLKMDQLEQLLAEEHKRGDETASGFKSALRQIGALSQAGGKGMGSFNEWLKRRRAKSKEIDGAQNNIDALHTMMQAIASRRNRIRCSAHCGDGRE